MLEKLIGLEDVYPQNRRKQPGNGPVKQAKQANI
jgi:hypothetical protein